MAAYPTSRRGRTDRAGSLPGTRRGVRFALALGIVAAMLISRPSEAVPGMVVVAPPGGLFIGYANGNVTLPKGATLYLFNSDELTPHNVTSRSTRKAKVGGRSIRVPVFVSVNAGTGGTAEVRGSAQLKPGVYQFYCSMHDKMTGSLTVQ